MNAVQYNKQEQGKQGKFRPNLEPVNCVLMALMKNWLCRESKILSFFYRTFLFKKALFFESII